MEIFQTIWTALTAENKILTKVITIPLIIIEVTITMLLFSSILRLESDKRKKIIYVSCFSLIAIFSLFFVPGPYNTFLNVFACPVLVLIIFKTNFLKAILAEIIPYIFFVVTSSILIGLFVSVLNNSPEVILNIPIYKIIFSSLTYLLIYFLYRICKHYNLNLNFNFNFFKNIKNKTNKVIISNLIIGLFAIGIQSYIVAVYINKLPFILTISSLIILLIYFLISIFSLYRTNKLEITTQQLEEEQLYNKTLNILYDNIRGFKHDFQNIMHSLGGYISTNNMEGLKTYYKELLPDSLKINQLDILNPESINNPAIYSLLTSKYHKADELGITMNIEAFLNMQNINMKTYELTRILGILLDNAIEAAQLCDKKIVNVTIRKDNKVKRQLFIIENTYTNKNVSTDKIFEKGYTSKAKEDKVSHGLGLWAVRKILKKNNNLNLFTSKTNDYFKQQLEIYC